MKPWFCFACIVLLAGVPARAEESYDVVIYGGNAAGLAAAIQTARMGKTVAVVEPSGHLGGMTTSGLGATDIGNKAVIGGIAREFYRRLYRHYQQPDAWFNQTREEYLPKHPDNISESLGLHWFFEPHVASQVFDAMLDEHADLITVFTHERLDLEDGVAMDGKRIASIRTESGRVFAAQQFIDCSYEGDLMAGAGVDYTVGRESNDQYGETLNGIRAMAPEKSFGVDPYVIPGDRASGTVVGVDPRAPGEDGAADRRVQAYNFRLCLTDDPDNRAAITEPQGYDPAYYELVARFVESRPHVRPGRHLFKLTPMPNRKTDSNNLMSFSTDFVNFSHDWPEATHAERDALWQKHKTYIQGFLYFLGHHERIPPEVREQVRRWGLAKDEFTETDHWPPQLYVREARRMVGAYVITQNHCEERVAAQDVIGLASYPMDSHQVSRFADDQGRLRLEGAFWKKVKPYGVNYRALTPKAEQCINLLVPVGLSATHAAYGSLRMEPVFMILGQSAATAAALAIDQGVAVQQVNVPTLQQRLRDDGQVLEFHR